MKKKKLIEIEKRERKYFEIVRNIFSTPKNIAFVKKSMKSINTHLKSVKGKKKNQVEDSLEQIVRTILFMHAMKQKTKWKPAFFPVGSDVTFELSDCFLFCDAKTIADDDADAKKWRIQVQANESTYSTKTPYIVKRGDNKKKKIRWEGPNISKTIEKKHVITLFISFHYKEVKKKYKIKEAVIYCIPNGMLSEEYGNLIENYKGITWKPNKTSRNRRGIGTNARFPSERFKKAKLEKGWKRAKKLPDYN